MENERAETHEEPGFCALCRSRCGATFTIKDGKLDAAGPAPDHPTGAALCLKGKAAPEILYSDDRILYPMRRTLPKTSDDPGWERITWDEALEEVASRLNTIKAQSGAESVAFGLTSPSGSSVSDGLDWIERFIRSFGSPNTMYATEICNWHKDHAHKFTFGTGILYPEYSQTDLVLLWGFNPSAVWLDQAKQVADAKSRGAKVVAIDPRNAGYARGADQWMRIKPGTDGLLAQALAKILIDEKAFDCDFIRRWTNGPLLVREDTGLFLRSKDINADGDNSYVAIDPSGNTSFFNKDSETIDGDLSLSELFGQFYVKSENGDISCRPAFDLYYEACSSHSLDEVSKLTTIPVEQIEATAQALIETKSVAYYCWTGVAQHSQAVQTDRAIATLMALKGCYDKPGGNVAYSKHVTNPASDFTQWPDGQREKALGLDVRPIGPPSMGWVTADDVYSAILKKEPYSVRAMMVFGANLVVSHAGADRGKEALTNLEFHVHCDSVMTPTAKFADIFLPINTPWEREGLRVGFEVSQEAEELIQLRKALVPSRGESRSDTEVLFDLAQRVGLSSEFFHGDIDAGYSHILEPTGISVAELRENPKGIRKSLTYRPQKYSETEEGRPRGFETDTRRIEFYSELLHRHGYPPVPTLRKAINDKNEFPLILTTANSGYFTHSAQRHIPSLRRRQPEPIIELCSTTADKLGFLAEDLVEIETRVAKVQMKLAINDALHPEVAVASYGFWQENKPLGLPGFDPFSDKGANYNRMIPVDNSDPLSGAVPHRSTPCRLSLADGITRTKPAWLGFRKATISSVEKVLDDVTAVAIKVDDLDVLPDYKPGQHITFKIPGKGQSGDLIRCYSLVGASNEANRNVYTIAVKRVLAPPDQPDLLPGQVSGYINDDLTVDDRVEIKAPSGSFIIPLEPNTPLVLIAGGIGVTPFISTLQSALQVKDLPPIRLIYANRNSRTHAFRDRLKELERRLPSLSVLDVYSEPCETDQRGIQFDRHGFVNLQDLELDTLADATQIYQCGPPVMMRAVEKILQDYGFPRDQLFEEAFTAPISNRPIPDGPFEVRFSKSGRTLTWTKDCGSLLQLGQAAGIDLNSGCQAGQCGACNIPVLEGTTVYRTDVDADEEGSCLSCQAVPSSDLVLNA